jgi:hypothetical protein
MSLFGFGKSYKPDENVTLLTTVYDFGTRAVVESLLREAEIPYILKERGGAVPVITGSSVFGTDFFVKETDLDTATELIAPVFGDETVETEECDEEEEQ